VEANEAVEIRKRLEASEAVDAGGRMAAIVERVAAIKRVATITPVAAIERVAAAVECIAMIKRATAIEPIVRSRSLPNTRLLAGPGVAGSQKGSKRGSSRTPGTRGRSGCVRLCSALTLQRSTPVPDSSSSAATLAGNSIPASCNSA
jgi:hypothetical protein